MPTEVDKVGREHIEAYILTELRAHMPATANQRFRSLQQLFKWLEEEDRIPASPTARMKPPNVPALDRYLRLRKRHRLANSDWLWLALARTRLAVPHSADVTASRVMARGMSMGVK
jgi:hypothetical protein